jgi:hypothetical protein
MRMIVMRVKEYFFGGLPLFSEKEAEDQLIDQIIETVGLIPLMIVLLLLMIMIMIPSG